MKSQANKSIDINNKNSSNSQSVIREVNSASRTPNMKKGLLNLEKYSSTIGTSNNKITEKIDEEDKNSDGDFDNDEGGDAK